MRVAALAFGILAGLVASLILALGGLDAGADLIAADERQAQAIRFGFLVIANIGVFGAALVLTAPLAASILLVLGALAWIGAALLTHFSTGLVLITPPALLLVAAVLSLIAHLRRPRVEDEDDPQIEIIAPLRSAREEEYGDEEEVGIPAFAAEPARAKAFDDERIVPVEDDWNPRRRQPPPPRAKPAFRPVEDEYDDEEPSGFSQFALSLSSILSFGLYAALAGAALLIVWNFRGGGDTPPAAVVADTPSISSEAAPAPAPSAAPTAISSVQPPASPVLVAPQRQQDRLPSRPAQSSQVALAEPSQEPDFAGMSVSEGAVQLPSLPSLPVQGESQEPSVPPGQAEQPPAAPAAPAPEPVAPAAASVPARGQPFPRPLPIGVAVLRTQPAPAPVTVATPRQTVDNTGL